MKSELNASAIDKRDPRAPGQLRDVLGAWHALSEDEKVRLLPDLLIDMQDWRSVSQDERFLVSWLRRKFARAGLTFAG